MSGNTTRRVRFWYDKDQKGQHPGMINGGDASVMQFINKYGVSLKYGDSYTYYQDDNQTTIAGDEHFGLDIPCPEGTPFPSFGDGEVIEVDYQGKDGDGVSIKVKDANGGIRSYQHLKLADVFVGDTVKTGQILGTTGNTGENTTGAHLHTDYYNTGSGDVTMEWKPDNPTTYQNPWEKYSGK